MSRLEKIIDVIITVLLRFLVIAVFLGLVVLITYLQLKFQ